MYNNEKKDSLENLYNKRNDCNGLWDDYKEASNNYISYIYQNVQQKKPNIRRI